MEIAHDSYRRTIRADDAERGGRYSCPHCGVRVVLARGRIQADHFRHVGRTPGERKKARQCELFVTSQGGGGYGSSTYPSESPVEPSVQLYATWSDRDGQLRWALHLAIPRPTVVAQFQYFRVDEDAQSQSPRDIPFEQLRLKRFLIRARQGKYNVRGFNNGGNVVWCPPSSANLQAHSPNIFEVSTTGGFLLDPDEALVPGRNYLVLSHKDFSIPDPPEVPFPELSRSSVCDPRGFWRAHLVFIPAFTSDELDEWCLEALGRCVADSPASLEIVCPPAVERENGVLVLEDRAAIILFLGTGWPDSGSCFELTFPNGHSPECPLPTPARFHRLSVSKRGDYEVHVRDNSQVLSKCISVTARSVPQVLGVKLFVLRPGKVEAEAIDLLDAKANDAWNDVLTKPGTFDQIKLPDGLTLDLFWRRQDGQPEHRLTLSGVQFVRALTACLDSKPTHARLDAGPFGTVEWHAPVATLTRNSTIVLPNSINLRIRWLLQAHQGISVELGERLPSQLRACNLTRLADSSQPIVKAFLNVAQWPWRLLPHVRSVARDLVKLTNAGC